METLVRNIIQNGDWVLQTNLILTGVFFLITLGFTGAILSLRLSKIIKNRKTKKYKELFSNFINRYVFDEDAISEKEVRNFKQKYVQNTLSKRVAIQVLLIFEQNFKGEANERIKELFNQWDLKEFIETDLKSGKWYKIARAIYISSELNLESLYYLIEEHLDAEKDELRQQAMLYFIQFSGNGPLDFLDRIKKPLTRWEQIYIEECLKTNYTGTPPDFSRWLDSKLISVQTFSINMIGEYNQFENIPLIIPFLSVPNQELKKEVINSLSKLVYPELVPHLLKIFKNETPAIKSIILNTISKIGSIDDFLTLSKMIPKDDWVNKQVFFNLRHVWKKEQSLSIL